MEWSPSGRRVARLTIQAKDVRVHPIRRRLARQIVERYHYSGRAYPKSVIHFGVFAGGRCLGAIQLGEGISTPNAQKIIPGTRPDGYLEINRMALSDELPRNSESRALAYVLRTIPGIAPAVEWIVSYADACQCGDGTIYRAVGMTLTKCRRNTTLWRSPSGLIVSDVGLRTGALSSLDLTPSATVKDFLAAGLERLRGYQLRYMRGYSARARAAIAAMEIDYADIPPEARMYRGHACAGVAGPEAPPPVGVRSHPHAPYPPQQAELFPRLVAALNPVRRHSYGSS